MSDELLEVKPEFMGFHNGEYPGAFPPKVEARIRKMVVSPCLHLFSGSSRIGDVRVDLLHHNATINQDVYQFILEDNRDWEWLVLDPVYQLESKHLAQTLKQYANVESVSGNILYQRVLEAFMQRHVRNILWFDTCAPKPDGFERVKFWVYLQGSYRSIRALTWLKRKGERLA